MSLRLLFAFLWPPSDPLWLPFGLLGLPPRSIQKASHATDTSCLHVDNQKFTLVGPHPGSTPEALQKHPEAPQNPTRSHQISPDLTRSHQISPNLTRSHQIPPDLTRSHQISPDLNRSHQIPPDLTRSHQISPDFNRSHQISPDLTRSHQISPDRRFCSPRARRSWAIHLSTCRPNQRFCSPRCRAPYSSR